MVTTLSFVKNYLENLSNPYGGYNAIMEITLKEPFRKSLFSPKTSKMHLSGIIPSNENRGISSLLFFTSKVGFMFEYENSRFLVNYNIFEGTGIEGWKEHVPKEVSELSIKVDSGNVYQQALPNSTLNLLSKDREADFIIKSPIDTIVDLLNEFSGTNVCRKYARSKIDGGILDIYLKGDYFIEKEDLINILNTNQIWRDLNSYGIYEIYTHSEVLKKRMRVSPMS